MKNISFRLFVLTMGILFFCILNLPAQGKINVKAGAGFPELLNIGGLYAFHQSQIGGSIGYGGHSVFSLTGDYFYHFGRLSDLSARKVWYSRWSFSYIKEKNEYELFKTRVLGTRIGREFNLSKSLGFAIDAGLTFRLSEEKTVLKPRPVQGWNIHFDFGILEYVLTSFGLHLFYRL